MVSTRGTEHKRPCGIPTQTVARDGSGATQNGATQNGATNNGSALDPILQDYRDDRYARGSESLRHRR